MTYNRIRQYQVGLTPRQHKIIQAIAFELGYTYRNNLRAGEMQASISQLLRDVADGNIKFILLDSEEIVYANEFRQDDTWVVSVEKVPVNIIY